MLLRIKKERIVLSEIHLRTTGRHLSNGITQCYLPPDGGDLHPNRAGWYSIYRPHKDERLSWPSWLDVKGCKQHIRRRYTQR